GNTNSGTNNSGNTNPGTNNSGNTNPGTTNQPDCNEPFAGQTYGTYSVDDQYGPIYSVYSVAQTAGGGYDVLIMQGITNSGAPTTAGTFNLASTAGFATIAFTGCSDHQEFPDSCANAYMANGGTLTATALTAEIGGTFAGNLSAVTMVPNAQLPVSGTGTYCFSSFSFNVTFEDPDAAAQGGGAPGGEGASIGEVMEGEFTLKNCNGQDVQVHAAKGNTEALWLTYVAEWCPNCPAAVSQMYQATSGVATSEVEAYVVIGESQQQQQPATQESCARFQSKMGTTQLDMNRVLIDGNYNLLFSKLNPYFQQQGDQYAWGVPFEAVLDGNDFTYTFASQAPTNTYQSGAVAVNALRQ
ncbi:MAG: hypothetical protein VYA34_02100, partial [Myxococcota bacterium]|nr:hypothetical protein [Myxococcota bacterium]